MSTGSVGSHTNLPVVYARKADAATEGTPPESTTGNGAIARDYPAGTVSVENTGLKRGLQIPGGLLAVGGATLLAISLLSRRAPGAVESRLLASPLLWGGGMVGAGAVSVVGAELLPPKQVVAAATNIPTRIKAQEIANSMTERRTKVVQDTAGKFAVIDEGPLTSRVIVRGNSYGGGYGHYHSGHYHDHYHYSGDHHYHRGGYSGPWYPDHGSSYPDPYYPTPGSYPTSPGDDFGYDWNPSYPPAKSGGTAGGDDGGSWSNPGGGWSGGSGGSSSGGTSGGDDGGSSWNPPPSSYEPPSYNDGGGYSGGSDWGNSSSNGNPSEDDF